MGEEQRASPPAPPPPSEAEVTAEEEVQARAAPGVPSALREPPGWFLRAEQGRVRKKRIRALDVFVRVCLLLFFKNPTVKKENTNTR